MTERTPPARWKFLMSVVAALLLGACGQPAAIAPVQPAATAPPVRTATPAPVAGPQVTIDNFSFTPGAITVAVGTSVTWVNHDDVPHTVTAQDHSYTSPGLDTDETYTHQFTAPGSYTYYCTIHPQMTATLIVR